MRPLLLTLVGLLNLTANVPYIRDILRGKTKPNIASWSTWTLIDAISATAAFVAGSALNTVILAASYFIGASVILALGLFRGTRKYTPLDGVCQALAIIGVIAWHVTNDPNLAIAFAVMADILAVIPTIVHSYRYPEEETWATFAIASFGALLFLCLSTTISFAALAIPIDFFVTNLIITLVIIYRGRHMVSK